MNLLSTRLHQLSIVSTILAIGFGSASAGVPVYTTDFEGGVGPEWSSSTVDNSYPAAFTRFHGRFGNQQETLTLNNLKVGVAHTLLFDLLILDSWDGSNGYGPDTFRVVADGQTLFDHTISQFGGPQSLTTPPDAQGQFGFSGWNDSIFRSIELQFTPQKSTAVLSFEGANLQGLDDESWGIDNVSVWPSSELGVTDIVSTTLPVEASSKAVVVDHFSIHSRRVLQSAAARNAANYELRHAGSNGNFGDNDDSVYAVVPTFTEGGKSVGFALPTNPLPAGLWRFRTLPGLVDLNGSSVASFVRNFEITDPAFGRIENTDNNSLPGATALPMLESPVGLNFYSGYGIGSFDRVGDVDYWRFDAEAGDRVSITLYAHDQDGVYPIVYLRTAADVNLVGVGSGYYEGFARIQDFVIPSPGTFYVRVWSDSAPSQYQFRVEQSRGIQLETEGNDPVNSANRLAIQRAAGSVVGRVAGALDGADGGDSFNLGELNAGNSVALNLAFPGGSILSVSDATLTLERVGESSPSASSSSGSLNHTIAVDGTYVVRVNAGTKGIRAQYVVNASIEDAVAPVISAVDLPVEGGSSTALVNRLSVSLSESLDPVTATDSANYELRWSKNAIFGDDDDVVYPVTADSYTTGTTLGFSIGNSPIQPGHVRFTIGTGLKDRSGNHLAAPYIREFTVENLGDFVLEDRSNDSQGTATPLGPLSSPDGSFFLGNYLGAGSAPFDLAKGDLNGDGIQDLVVANISSGNVSVLLGDPFGAFAGPVNYPSGSGPIAVTVGDVNGDSRADIVVANYYEHSVSVLINKGTGLFAPPVVTPVGTYPRAVRLGDLDGDGTPEILVANSGAAFISILKRVGDGSYSRTDVAAGNGVWGVAVGDFNGDNQLDVVAANQDSSTVSVLLNNGIGGLSAGVSYSVGTGPRDVAVGDLDGDGKLDLAVLSAGSQSLNVLKGAGDGTFGQVVTYGGTGSEPYHLTLADLNADGKLDVAVAAYGSSYLTRYFNQGNGIFGTAQAYAVSYNPIGIVAGDWDGDGVIDLATANHTGANVSIWMGNRGTELHEDPFGLFTALGRGSLTSTSDYDFYRFTAKAGDVLTVAVENPGNPGASQLYYRVDGINGNYVTDFYSSSYFGWGQSTPVVIPADGSYTVYARYNYDFRGEYQLRVSLARGGLQMENENTNNDSIGGANTPVFALDGQKRGATVAGYIGVGDAYDHFRLGNLTAGTTIRLKARTPNSTPLDPGLAIVLESGTVVAVTGPLDDELEWTVPLGGDGAYLARVHADFGSGLLAQYLVDIELLDLTPPVVTSVSLPAEGSTTTKIFTAFSIGFNEDLDATTVNEVTNYELRSSVNETFGDADDSVYSLSPLAYTTGLGTTLNLVDGPLQPGHYQFTIQVGLRDRSGNVLAEPYKRRFTIANDDQFVLENRSNDSQASATPLGPLGGADGSIAGQLFVGTGPYPHDIARADVNGDGKLDLVTANYGTGDVSVLLGNGDGTFRAEVRYTAGGNAVGVAVGDLNGDGKPDIATANYNSNTASVLINLGNGTFGAPTTFAVGTTPMNIRIGDLNGDGTSELVVGNAGSSFITVLKRTEEGSYDRVDVPAGNGVFSLGLADVNGDSKVDVVVVDADSSSVSILLNDGKGGLSASMHYPVGGGPRDVALVDLDKDGHLDVVTLNAGSQTLSVLLGKADGTFAAATQIGGTGYEPYHLATGDFDADGNPDILVAGYGSSQLVQFLGRGDGTFESGFVYSVANNPIGVVTGDWNGDGIQDLATSNYNGSQVAVWLGNRETHLQEGPSGLFTGLGRGSLSATSDYDYYRFSAKAGDVLSVAVETLDYAPASQLYYRVDGPNGAYITDFYANTYYGWGQSSPVTLPVDGSYTVFARYNYDYRGEYRIRVNLARGGLQIEQEENNAIAQANSLILAPEGGKAKGRIAGYVNAGDLGPGDFYRVGNLTEGDVLHLSLESPASSRFSGLVSLYGPSGTQVVAGQTETETQYAVGAGEGGDYFARVISVPPRRGTAVRPNIVFAGGAYAEALIDVPEDAMTVTFWFYSQSGNAGLFEVAAGPLGSGGHDRHVYLSGGNIYARLYSNEVIGSSGLNLADGRWHHVAYQYGGSIGGQRIYVDGVRVASGTKSYSDFTWQNRVSFGYSADLGYLNGSIEDVTLWRTAISEDTIAALMKAPPAGDEADLLASWSLNEGSGTELIDGTGHAYSGTLYNSPVWGVFSSQSTLHFGLLTEYVLNVVIDDTVLPVVTGLDLASEGGSNSKIINRLSVQFSEDMDPATLAQASNFELRWSANSNFGDEDDVVYSLAPETYLGGLNLGLSVLQGPLQVGNYRFTATKGLHDRAGNSLASVFVRTFTIVSPDGFVLENRSNDTQATATPLGPQTVPDRTLAFDRNLAVGSNPYDIAKGDLNGDGFEDLAIASINSTTVSILYGSADGTFRQAPGALVGRRGIGIAVGDLNGDSKNDLVIANYYDESVSILINQGGAVFGAPVVIGTGRNPTNLRLADLNGDGTPEILVANLGEDFFSILKRNAEGGYGRVDMASGGGAYGIGAGDFNGDGKLDVAVGNANANTLSILLNDGTGVLAPAVNYPVGNYPRDLAIGDIDKDGVLDIAVLNGSSQNVSLFKGVSGGTFVANGTLSGTGSEPYHLILPDLDGDGHLDIAIAGYGSSYLVRFFNEGDGSFGPAQVQGVAGNPIGIVAGDWNSDGVVDLATANYQGSSVTIGFGNRFTPLVEDPPGLLTGLARGTLANTADYDYFKFSGKAGDLLSIGVETVGNPPASQLYYEVDGPNGVYVTGFYAASYYGYGQSAPVTLPLDGAYTVFVRYNYDYRGEYRLRVTLGRGGLQLETENYNDAISGANYPSYAFQGGKQSARIAGSIGTGEVTDTFGLGSLGEGTEIVLRTEQPASSPLESALEILKEDGEVVSVTGPFDDELHYKIPPAANGAYFARVRSTNGAGLRSQYILDIDWTDAVPPTIASVDLPAEGSTGLGLLNRFTVTFSEDMRASTVTEVANYELRSSLNEAFGDADDVVYTLVPSAYTSGLSASYFIPSGPLQPGNYRFTARTGLADSSGNLLAAPYVRKFRLEGRSGFVHEGQDNNSPAGATTLSSNPSSVFDKSFLQGATRPSGANPYNILGRDVDGDGNPDLIVANYGGANVSVSLGNGDGTFRPGVDYATGSNPYTVVIADLNGDGVLDFATADYASNRITLWFGVGDGTFGNSSSIEVPGGPIGLTTGDFNEDGLADLVVVRLQASRVEVFLGIGQGVFVSAGSFETSNTSYLATNADVNGDSKLDLIVSNYSNSSVSVFLGDGHGGFGAGTAFATGNGAHSIVVTDLTGDGIPDIMVANERNASMSLLKGNGDGTFQDKIDFSTGGSNPYLTVSDLDADGRPDLIVGNYRGYNIGIWYNLGGGSFAPPIFYNPGYAPTSVAVADWNRDGRPDLASANYDSGNVSFYFGNRSQPLSLNAAGHGIRSASGYGSLSDGGDADYWSFSGKAGDRVVVGIEVPGSPGASQLYYRLMGPNGETLSGYYPDYYGSGQMPIVALPADGTYSVLVSPNYQFLGEYRIRVVLSPPDVSPENESNDSPASASGMVLVANGDNQSGTGVGYIRVPGDLDYFDLGVVEAGKSIFLNVRLLNGATINPVVSVYDASNGYKIEVPGGRAFDAVAEVAVAATGRYYAVVRGSANQGGLSEGYVLETQILPTSSVAFPNLQVTSLTPPSGNQLKSGDAVQIQFVVGNVGRLPTGDGNWSDRLVLSQNQTYGDLDDIELGVVPHVGALESGGHYEVIRTLNLPDGIEGAYYLIAQTDSGNAIPEFILEGDNVTMSENPFQVTRANYPDLQVGELGGLIGTSEVQVSWKLLNQGTGNVGIEFRDAVVVRNLATGLVEYRSERVAGNSLASQQFIERSVSVPIPGPGRYALEVTADSGFAVYEFDDTSHTSAEGNNFASTFFDIFTDLTVAGLRVEPSGELRSGTPILVHWEDQLTGNHASSGSWSDRVQIVNRTTGLTLLDTSVPHLQSELGNLSPGQSHAREYAFVLPHLGAGVGAIEILVTVDHSGQVLEHNALNSAEGNNLAKITRTVSLAAYPDLAAFIPTLPLAGDSGQPVEFGWSISNLGTATASGNWVDHLYLSPTPDGSNARFIGSLPFVGSIAAQEVLARSATFTVPSDLAGARYLVVLTEANNQLLELSEANNRAVSATPITLRRPNLKLTALSGPTGADAGEPISIEWTVANSGDGSTFADWNDAVYLSPNANGTGGVLLGNFSRQGPLVAGGTSARSGSVTLPLGTSGNRYLVVVTDSGGAVVESNEADNTRVATAPIAVRAPDLTVTGGLAPTTAAFGESISVRFTLANIGNGTAKGAWLDSLYLSADAAFGGDTLLISRPAGDVSPLAAGASTNLVVNVTLPPFGVPGTYYLFVRNDETGVVSESNESNNVSAGIPLNLVLPPLPDLVVGQISAPTTVLPGQPFTVTWVTRNVGDATTQSSWIESLYFSTDAVLGNDNFLLNALSTTPLVSGTELPHSASITLPSDGPAGTFRVIVATDSGNALLESNKSNNTGFSAETVTVPLTLTVTGGANTLAENDVPVSFLVTRNGPRTADLVVTLASSDTTGLTVPATITIPVGSPSASFLATPVNDGVVTENKSVSLAIGATGFVSLTRPVEVRNVNLPRLALALDASVVTEGLTVGATVTRDIVTASSLDVTVNPSDAVQIIAPSSVTIPAGKASVTFVVIANDDSLIGNGKEYTVSVAAPGMEGDSRKLSVTDNDAVGLTFEIAPVSISEGAGAGAASGTITRSPVSNRALALKLVSSGSGSALAPASLVIPADQASVTFPIAAIDNAQVDGNRTVTFTPTVLVNGAPYSTGPSASVTITDDDGPTLKLSVVTKVVREGLILASDVTVTRNTDPTAALEVQLSTDIAGKLTVPPTVTIPAGASSATFQVGSVEDGVTGGNKTVTVTGSAVGFTAGSDSITVTDIDLPDLVVSGFQKPEAGGTETLVSTSYTVKNQGVASASGKFTQRLYLSTDPFLGNDTFLSQYTWPGPELPAGGSFDVAHSFYLPRTPGNYYLIAVVDVSGGITELKEDNNSLVSVTPIRVDTTYTAMVETDLTVALAGTSVPLHGRVFKRSNGDPVPFGLATVHIRVRGTSRTIAVLADADGTFEATFTPLPQEAGTYEIGADHPGLTTAATQDTFTLLGMKATPDRPAIRLVEGSSASGTVTVENLSIAALHGLGVQASGNLPNVGTVALVSDSTLPGLGSVQVNYTVSAADSSYIAGTVVLKVTTSEGAELQIPVSVSIDALRTVLVATPGSIQGGMKRGEQRSVEFSIKNQGGLSSGPLSVALPPGANWLRTTTPTLPALGPGEETTIGLLLSPASDLPLGPFNGSLNILGQNGSLNVAFNFLCLSDAKGDLLVRAIDEFTFYAAGAPKVSGASVEVTDAFTGAVVQSGLTDDQGEFLAAGLFEGYYNILVRADKHSSFRGAFLVRPGATTDAEAFLSRQTVSYNWTVTPIEIEDRYKITIETTFETFVPTPVITLDPPSIDLNEYPLPEQQILLTVKNSGLIAAQGGKLTFGTHPYYEIIPLVEDVGLIPAMGSVTIPVTIKNHSPGTGPAASGARRGVAGLAGGGSVPCSITAGFEWFLVCGLDNKYYWVPLPVFGVKGDCNIAPSTGGGYYYGGPVGGSGPAGGGTTWYTGPVDITPPPQCQKCDPKTYVKNCYRTDLGNYIRPLASGLLGTIKSLPVIKNLKSPDIKAEAQLCTCCLEGGESYEGKGSASVEIKQIELFLPIAGTFFEIKEDVGNEEVKLQVSLGSIRGELTAGGAVGGEAEAKCRLSKVKARAFARVQAEPKLVADVGIKYSFTDKITKLKTFSGEDRAYVEVGTKVYGELYADSDTGVGGQACVDPIKVTGGISITDPVSGQIHRFELVKELTQRICVPNPAAAAASSFAFHEGQGVTFGEAMHLANAASEKALQAAQAEMQAAQEHLASMGQPKLVPLASSAGPAVSSATTSSAPSKPQAETLLRRGAKPADASGVCARVKLRLEQAAVLTRNAFDARLELVNSDENLPLTDIQVQLSILNTNGDPVNEVFAIKDPVLNGLGGVDGSGTVAAKATGTASWTLIPTRDAAPTEATVYRVGALLQYTVDGNSVTVPLDPVAITVYPDPLLVLQYFHQRDVHSDDPFTPEVEPSIPYSLAVLAKNQGFGDAKGFKITSAQPKIIENEKGLLIDFQLIATQVGNDNLQPSLTVDFGTIPARQNKVARWLFTSTLQGLFVDYSATFEHVDAIAGKKTSLIDEVSIHEMIHLVDAGGPFSDGQPDFLVNDVPDDDHLPDTLYLSDGTTNAVQVVTSALNDGPPSSVSTPVHLTAALPSGWVYLRIPDPADGRMRLRRVVRGDGFELPVGIVKGNAWVTPRTFIGHGKRPIVENILHLLDNNSDGNYTLYYEDIPLPDTEAPVSQVNRLPENSPKNISVTWNGTDSGGSGLAAFDVYVSEDGGAYSKWLSQTTARAATYPGAVGHRYAFYTRASDATGNLELGPAVADAETFAAFETSAPSLSTIPTLTTPEDQALTGIPLTVLDADTPQDQLSFSVRSSNLTLIDPADVEIEGTTSARTVRIRPASNRFGQSRLVIRVSDGSFSAETEFLVTVEPRNDAPVAAPDLVTRKPGKTIRVSSAQLLANDTDAEFDQLTVIAVSSSSANGGRVRLKEGQISYTPPLGANADADDSFTYSVTDGAATSTGLVTVHVGEASTEVTKNLLSAVLAPDGLHLFFIGIVGKRYEIQKSPTLEQPVWKTVGSAISDSHGRFEFVDPSPQTGDAFYRATGALNP